MIPKRIIPLFLLKGKRLFKGTRFSGPFVDVGDPLSQAMIYDAQGAEEIAIVDIEATKLGRCIDTDVINAMIRKCRLPIAAGGGISSLKHAYSCFVAGADKIIINTSAVTNPKLVTELASEFGSQSVVVSVDFKRQGDKIVPFSHSGSIPLDRDLKELLCELVDAGAGEIILTSIDHEGTLSGMDIDLYKSLVKTLTVPLIASGGIGSYDNMVELFLESDCSGCALGKMLVLRDYDIVRIKAYLTGRNIFMRDA